MRSRLLTFDELDEAQRFVWEENIKSKRGRITPPVVVWLHSPEMALHATRLGAFLRFETSIPVVAYEIAILLTARHWSSHYEWYAHKKIALEAGVDPDIVEAIRDRRTPRFSDACSKTVYDVTKSLYERRRVERALYDEAIMHLGERGLVDLIGICSYYSMVSMTLNTFDIELPEGEVSDL